MELEEAIRGRRSIRRFKMEAVPMSRVKGLIEAASCAPSATNRQHWEFVAVTERSLVERLVEEAGAQRILLNAPALVVVLYDRKFNEQYHANIQSVSAAVQNLMLKAYEEGLGTCWVCGFGSEERVKAIIKVPERLGVMCFILLGKPDETPSPPKKRPAGEILHENFYGGEIEELPKTIRPSGWTLEQLRKNQELTCRSSHLGSDYEIYGSDEAERISAMVSDSLPPKGATVVNIVGYDGTMLRKLEGVFSKRKLVDVELSDAAADFVRFKAKWPAYVIWNGKIPLGSSSAEMVVFIFSLEKLPSMEPFLREARRILKPGGKMLIFAKSRWSLYGIIYYGVEKVLGMKEIEGFYLRSGPFEPLRIKRVVSNVKELGFSVKKRPVCFVPPEVLRYKKMVDGYRKRRGGKMRLGSIISPGVRLLSFIHRMTSKRSIPFSSSVCIIAEKSAASGSRD